MYRNALLATDGSETARAVFPHVRQILDPEGTVTVVEVIDDVAHIFARTTPAGFEFGTAALDVEIAEKVVAAQRTAAEEHLAEARATLEGDGIRHVETAVLTGMPGDVIVHEAAQRRSEIVLMGTHGRSGLRRTVLGSVADYVLRHLDGTPVLLVHANEK
jgi:nucleotide-binding universal stress UspA family protein